MNNNYLLIILSVLGFFFVAIPAFVVSAGLGVLFWLVAIGMFFWGWIGRSNEIKAERIRQRGELEEEGRQRAMDRHGSPPEQILKETVVTREVVLISAGTAVHGIRKELLSVSHAELTFSLFYQEAIHQ